MLGHVTVHSADRGIELKEANLRFTNPRVPYSTELHPAQMTGFYHLFTQEFTKASDRSECLHQSPLFKTGGPPLLRFLPSRRPTPSAKELFAPEMPSKFPFSWVATHQRREERAGWLAPGWPPGAAGGFRAVWPTPAPAINCAWWYG